MTILAETSGLNSIFTNVLLVVHVVLCLLLCLTVMMQRPKQEGLGAAFGGGMTDQAFGARTTDVLQKGTVYLATGLFIVTLILSILVGSASREKSVLDGIDMDKAAAVEENGAAAAAAAADMDAEKEITEEDLQKVIDAIPADTSEETPADASTETSEPAETPAETSSETPAEKPADQ